MRLIFSPSEQGEDIRSARESVTVRSSSFRWFWRFCVTRTFQGHSLTFSKWKMTEEGEGDSYLLYSRSNLSSSSDDWKPENARNFFGRHFSLPRLSPEPDLASPLLGPFPLARLAPHIREERMGPIGWSIRENAIAATVYRPRRPQWLMKTADVVLDGAWCGYGHRLSRLLES